MKIIIKFNEELESELEIKKPRDWVFLLYVQEGTKNYPDGAWCETGVDTVNSWIWEFNRFQEEGGTGMLSFWLMPYALAYHRQGDLLIFVPHEYGETGKVAFGSIDFEPFAVMLDKTAQVITDYWNLHFSHLPPPNMEKVNW